MTGPMISNIPRRFIRPFVLRSSPVSHRALAWLLIVAFCMPSITGGVASSQPRANFFSSLASENLSLVAILDAKDALSQDQFNNLLQKLLAKEDLSDSHRREASYVLGRSLQNSVKDEEKKQALALFDQSQSLPALRVLSRWHIVELATVLGPEKLVRRTLEQILKESDQDEKARATYALAQSYLRTKTIDQAVPLFRTIRENAKRTDYALGAAYYLGEIALSQAEASSNLSTAKSHLPSSNPITQIKDLGSYKEGIFLFCHYLKTSPTGHFAPVIIDRLTKLRNLPGQTSSLIQDALAFAYFSNSSWRSALDLWTKSKTDGNRKLEVATCLANLGFTSRAEGALLKYIQLRPDDSRSLAVANTICKALSKAEAINFYQRILAARPKALDVVLWNIAIRSSPPLSLQSYKELLNRYPNSPYAAESQWRLFWDKYKHKHNYAPQQLVDLAGNSAKKYSRAKSAPRFLFWAAELSEKMGNGKQAEYYYNRTAGLFPADYYAFRALDKLFFAKRKQHIYSWNDIVNHTSAANWSWPSPPELSNQTKNVEAVPLWELLRLRQYDEALNFVQSNQTQVKSWIYAKLNQPAKAITIANASLRGKPNSATLWQYAFPLLYGQEIDGACRTSGNVDPNLMRGLIREESYYDPKALSPAGAVGLTQLLPSTAHSIAIKSHISFTSPNQLFDALFNLKLGTEYVSSLLSLFQNNALFAVASYNSGSGPISGLLARARSSGTLDLDTFVEDIPFSETRDYVRNVFRSYWTYGCVY